MSNNGNNDLCAVLEGTKGAIDSECKHLLKMLYDSVKICTNGKTDCSYIGPATIRIYGEYRGTYKECLKAMLLISLVSGDMPAALLLMKKMFLMDKLDLN